MAGIGSAEHAVPTLPYCTIPALTCINYGSSRSLSNGCTSPAVSRYYVWHHVFVRPEIHYYHIPNNNNPNNNGFFNSNNVFRVGASIGYTFGGNY